MSLHLAVGKRLNDALVSGFLDSSGVADIVINVAVTDFIQQRPLMSLITLQYLTKGITIKTKKTCIYICINIFLNIYSFES